MRCSLSEQNRRLRLCGPARLFVNRPPASASYNSAPQVYDIAWGGVGIFASVSADGSVRVFDLRWVGGCVRWQFDLPCQRLQQLELSAACQNLPELDLGAAAVGAANIQPCM